MCGLRYWTRCVQLFVRETKNDQPVDIESTSDQRNKEMVGVCDASIAVFTPTDSTPPCYMYCMVFFYPTGHMSRSRPVTWWHDACNGSIWFICISMNWIGSDESLRVGSLPASSQEGTVGEEMGSWGRGVERGSETRRLKLARLIILVHVLSLSSLYTPCVCKNVCVHMQAMPLHCIRRGEQQRKHQFRESTRHRASTKCK